eukprot:gene26454-17553_t
MDSLEGQLQATLEKIYAAPQTSPAPPHKSGKKPMPQLQTVDLDLFASDDFRMYCYKIVPCSIRGPHEWTTCGFCHPGEKAQRRCPQKYNYTAIACPDLKTGECARGQNCFFAHSVFEYWLHPTRYRTQLCSYGTECKRSICFFAHHYGELRHSDQLSQLQAIERELEGDNGMGFQSGSRWAQPGCAIGPLNPKTPGRVAMNPHQQQLQRAGSQHVTPVQGFSASVANQQALLRAVNSLPSQDTLNNLNLNSPVPDTSNSMHTPLSSLSSHDIDSQMAAAQFSAPVSHFSANHLGSNNPYPSASRQSEDLQSALMGLLPDLLKHFGNGNNSNNACGPWPMAPQSSCPLDGWAKPQMAKATNADLFSSHLNGNVLSTSPVDVLSLASRASASCKSFDFMSSHGSDRSCSPVSCNRSEDGEETNRVAQAQGMMQVGSEQHGDASHMSMKMLEDNHLLSHSNWLKSISQLVNEPTTADMLPSIQELDQQLCKLSMKPSIELPPAGAL